MGSQVHLWLFVRKQQTDRAVQKQYRTEWTRTQGCTHAASNVVVGTAVVDARAGGSLLKVALSRVERRVVGAQLTPRLPASLHSMNLPETSEACLTDWGTSSLVTQS